MGDISTYFSRHEIACKCGCGFDTMDAETLVIADIVRVYNAASITPSSGCRCPPRNKQEDGGDESQHLIARAMDLPVKRPKAMYYYLCKRFPNKYGFGLYRTFVHVDSRKHEARWIA